VKKKKNQKAVLIQKLYRKRRTLKIISACVLLQKKRGKIIEELLKTESNYIIDLEKATEIEKEITKKHLMSPKQIASVFSNLSTIIPLNKALYQNLSSLVKQTQVSIESTNQPRDKKELDEERRKSKKNGWGIFKKEIEKKESEKKETEKKEVEKKEFEKKESEKKKKSFH